MRLIYIVNSIVVSAVDIFSLVLLVYCVSSWIIRDPFNKFMRILSMIVDPILNPVRNLLSKVKFLRDFPIDFSPIVVFGLCEMVIFILS